MAEASTTAARSWFERHGALVALGATGALSLAGLPVARGLRRRLPDVVADAVVSTGAVGIGWLSLEVLERLAPHRADWAEPDDERMTDLGYASVVLLPTVTSARLASMAITAAAGAVGHRLGVPRRTWSRRIPLPARVGAALLISEFVHYWHHRLSHDVPALWAFHEVHHSARRLYWLNGMRFHPVDEAPLLALQTLVLDLAGVDDDALLVHHIFKSINGLLQHANISGACGPLDAVLSTSEQHRLHHAIRSTPAPNYGAVLSIWDRAFGTREAPAEATSREPVGLPGARPFPRSLVGQMVRPFAR